MPANTPKGFPYPLPTEPVAEGAQAIRNLAEAIDASELAFAQFTGDVPITAGTEATANPIVTAPPFTANGTSVYLIEFYCPQVVGAGANATLACILYDGASSAGWLFVMVFASQAQQMPIHATRRLVPSAGAHTYSVRAFRTGAANAAFTAGAGGPAANVPGFIRVTRL